MGESRIFAPYRALGLVCNQIPGVLRYFSKRKLNTLICAIGNVFHSYNASTLRLISVSNSHPSDIECLAADGVYVYTSCSTTIRAFHLSRQVRHTYSGHTDPVHLLLPFGPMLISVSRSSQLLVFSIESEEITLSLSFSPSYSITSLAHPSTYLNKLLLGSAQGVLLLYNLKSSKLIHTFKSFSSGILSLAQSPAVDLFAIGLEDGRVLLHNIRTDETLFSFRHEEGPVRSLAFRSDGPPFLISSSDGGKLAVWDLEKQRLCSEFKAHDSSVVSVFAFVNEPLILTQGSDNALKTWVFDGESSSARLLTVLEGHSSPPGIVRFYPRGSSSSSGEYMVLSSGGEDSKLRWFSPTKPTKQNSFGTAGALSRKKAKRKHLKAEEVRYPPIVCLEAGASREAWDNLVACHSGSSTVSTWSTREMRLGEKHLRHKRFSKEFRNESALSCALSACGNFAFIGYSSGHLDKFNVQSGAWRTGARHSEAPVKALCTEGANRWCLSGDDQGVLRACSIKDLNEEWKMCFPSGIERVCVHRENSLLALALEDLSLLVVEIETRRVARQFSAAHSQGKIELCFSPGGHWLLSCSEDLTLKVWDLPSASLIDLMVFPEGEPCKSVSLAPNGEFLATCHEGKLGVYLWTNKLMFEPAQGMKPLAGKEEEWRTEILVEREERKVLLPSSSEEQKGKKAEMEELELVEEYKSPEQISHLLTLSGRASTYWANLLAQDLIRERNRPKEAARKGSKAPFFLPTISSVEGSIKFNLEAEEREMKEQGEVESRILKFSRRMESRSGFLRTLTSSEEDAFELLKQSGPAQVELEIRGLTDAGVQGLRAFLAMLEQRLGERRDFELVQAYLAVFMKVHWEVLVEDEECSEGIRRVGDLHRKGWKECDRMLNESLCLTQFLKTAVL